MKRYLGAAPLPWITPPVAPGPADAPAPPELTFDDSFFANLPDLYEPWRREGDNLDTQNLIDEDEAPGIVPSDDDPAGTEEDESFPIDVPTQASSPPLSTTNCPRRTIHKPAPFRIVNNPDDRLGQVHSTEIYNAHLAAAHQDSDVSAQELETEKLQSQAIDTSCDLREVLLAPEIDFEFGDEPIIEISSYY